MSAVQRLIGLLSSGDFASGEVQRLMAECRPYSLLLRAMARIARRERTEAWDDIRRAVAVAPRQGLVRIVASRLFFLLGDHRAALAQAAAASQLGVAAATMLRYHQAHEIGWHHEARAVLESALHSAGGPQHQSIDRTAADRLIERAFEHLLTLYSAAHYDDAAAAALASHLPRVSASMRVHVLAARVYERRGALAQALAEARAALALEATPSSRLEVARQLVELGAFDEARTTYESLLHADPASQPAREALARLSLWRGDWDEALAHAAQLGAQDGRSSAARRIRAAVSVLRGDHAGALAQLDALLRDDPADGEAYVWRAEAQLRSGRREAAAADADRSQRHGYSFAARAIRLLAGLNPGGSVDHATWEEFTAELTAMFDDAPAILAENRSDGVAALLERALVAMRGNRTFPATWVRADGTLARLPRSSSVRAAARQAMELIKIASPDETLALLDALVARFPDSSMPLVHRGELLLWLGRYADARADLEGAIAIHRQTRWAWYGLASIDILSGDPERALATCARGIQVMHNTEGPVAFIYRGEAYRLLGRLAEAREQLVRACELHPSRLSAWINLALVHGAAGDRAAQRDGYRRLARVAPGLLAEAAMALGDEVFRTVVLQGFWVGSDSEAVPGEDVVDRVLQQALTMMRGNRSSSCITFFTHDGQLRHVPRRDPAAGGKADSDDRSLGKLREVLIRALQPR